jgi:hypothetical protein
MKTFYNFGWQEKMWNEKQDKLREELSEAR